MVNFDWSKITNIFEPLIAEMDGPDLPYRERTLQDFPILPKGLVEW